MDEAVLMAKVRDLVVNEGMTPEDAAHRVAHEERTRVRTYREIMAQVQREMNEQAHEHQGNITIP